MQGGEQPILTSKTLHVSMRHGTVKFNEKLKIFSSTDLLLTLPSRDDRGSNQDMGDIRRRLGVNVVERGAFDVLRSMEQPRTIRLVEAPGLEIFDGGAIF